MQSFVDSLREEVQLSRIHKLNADRLLKENIELKKKIEVLRSVVALEKTSISTLSSERFQGIKKFLKSK